MKKRIVFLVICLMLLVVPVSINRNKLAFSNVYAENKTSNQKENTNKEAGSQAETEVGGEVTNENDLGNGNAKCAGIAGFVYYGVYVIKVLQIIVPIALILWGTIDLLKSIISGDEKKISAARKPFIQRLISAVIVFLLPWIANFFIGFASSKANSEWQQCWKDAWNGGNKSNIKSDDLGLWD